MGNFKVGAVAALYLSSLFAGSAHAEDAASVAARFGALDSFRQPALSPDGGKIAYISVQGDDTRVYVVDISVGVPRAILTVGRKTGWITGCDWTTSERLVCRARYNVDDGEALLGFTRLFAIGADGKGLVQLSTETNDRSQGIMQDGGAIIDYDVGDSSSAVLMTRRYVPDTQTGSLLGSNAEGLGVDAVDTVSLKRRRVEPPGDHASEYISDGHGNVRVMGVDGVNSSGYLDGTIKYFYRKANTKGWLRLSTVVDNGFGQSAGFNPYVVDAANDVVYGFDDSNGFSALYSISLDGAATRKLVLSRPDTDVDEMVRIGRDHRVVGVSYATDRRTIEYFDPELKRLSAALGKALPGQPLVNIVDASAGEGKLLIIASGDTDPGMLYLFDKASRKLDQVGSLRDALEGMSLAPMKPVTYKAADGTAIPAYLTLPLGGTGKNLPAIVMPHGGPSARDEWGFDWLVQYYAARGFAVLQPNFRGSAGYGSMWFQKNGFQSWKTAIGDVNDAGRWLLNEGIAAPGKLAVVGWSYGGYAALQGAVVDPDLYKAVVAIAPVTDLPALKREYSHYTSAIVVARFVGEGPHLHEGSPAQNAARIKAPVLLFHGDLDQNVGVGESRLMESRLKAAGKTVSYVEFPGLDHQLESAVARTRMLMESDAFLRKALGIAP